MVLLRSRCSSIESLLTSLVPFLLAAAAAQPYTPNRPAFFCEVFVPKVIKRHIPFFAAAATAIQNRPPENLKMSGTGMMAEIPINTEEPASAGEVKHDATAAPAVLGAGGVRENDGTAAASDEDEDDVFIEVTVSCPHKVGEGMSSYLAYKVIITSSVHIIHKRPK